MTKNTKVDRLNSELGNIDIYLLDQIMKGNYSDSDRILDAGCGRGRNMHWFIKNGFDIHGVDINPVNIERIASEYPHLKEKLKCCDILEVPYKNENFDHIICNAVLHFASNNKMFFKMVGELVRLLKQNGTLFIRAASNIGIENLTQEADGDMNLLPDGSVRFLLRRDLIQNLINDFNLSLIEPIKSVNVDEQRVMTTLLLSKRS